jgi:FkbM family methyltransferase
MISGFSEPWCEFQENNIRIINRNVCHGCFNRYEFNRGVWDWCPVFNPNMLDHCPDNPKLFECTKTITPDDVIDAIIADSYDNEFFTVKFKDNKISLNKPRPDAYNESDAFIYNEIFNNKEYETNKCKINKGDIVVDLGANIGIFSRYAWMKGAFKVFAFEPEKNNFEVLCKNNPNSENYNVAVSSYDGELDLHIDSTVGGHSILEIDINHTRTGELQTIECITLDTLFATNEFDKIDFLKVDTEGAEIEIFKGISDENLLKIDRISMEYHNLVFNFDLEFRKEFLSRFIKLGFKVFIKTMNDHLQYIYMHQE